MLNGDFAVVSLPRHFGIVLSMGTFLYNCLVIIAYDSITRSDGGKGGGGVLSRMRGLIVAV